MKSIRFNDLSKASQIFAESFVEKEPKIKSRKSLNESIENKSLKESYSIVDLETGERFGNFDSVESAMNKAQRYSKQCSATCAVVYSGVFGDRDLKVICGYKNGKERRVTNEALSDEAKANNAMIQKILNKKPSQLTAKEKKFLADNDLVKYSGTGGYRSNIRRNGASWSNSISKGDNIVTSHRNNSKNPYTYKDIEDVDQLNLLKKRDERSRAHYEADRDPDILAPQGYYGPQGKSRLQAFNKNYEKTIKDSKRYAKDARDFMDSYIETGGKLKADLAKYRADASRTLKDQAEKSLKYRPKFESLEKGLSNWRGVPGIKFKSNGSWGDPDLIYHGYTFNYWDIEDALWSNFLEETGYDDSDSDNPEVEQEFNEWLRDTAKPYLEDVIYGGYFKKGSRSWHDNY